MATTARDTSEKVTSGYGFGFFAAFFLLLATLWNQQPFFREARLQVQHLSELLLLVALVCGLSLIIVRRHRLLLALSSVLTILLLIPDLKSYFWGERRFSQPPLTHPLSVSLLCDETVSPAVDTDIRISMLKSTDGSISTQASSRVFTESHGQTLVIDSPRYEIMSWHSIQTGKGAALTATVRVGASKRLTVLALASLPNWWSRENLVHIRRLMGQVRHIAGDVVVCAYAGTSPYTDLFSTMLWTGRLDSASLGHSPYWNSFDGGLPLPVATTHLLVRGNFAVTELKTSTGLGATPAGLFARVAF